ncbi:MAG: hypothetical protein NC191_03665, partial [Muribaculaceae bacterium]|nr:hypothetical protein [Muribaculaceae bacterium]
NNNNNTDGTNNTNNNNNTDGTNNTNNTNNNTGWSSAAAADLNGVTKMTVHDGSGKTRDITGNFSITQPGAASGDYPKEIQVGSHRYQLVEGSSNPAKYKSVGDANNNEYRLEKNADGSFALNQYEGDSGYGVADIGKTTGTGTGKRTTRVSIPSNWKKNVTQAMLNNIKSQAQVGAFKTADDILNKMTGTKPSKADLIKYNPSIFVSTDPSNADYGKVKDPVDWSKLDIPSGCNIA